MILNKKGAGELIVNSIGVCAVKTNDKKSSVIIIAYSTAEDSSAVSFVATDFPKEGQYLEVVDFLTVIARAENVQTVKYVDDKNRLRDIYVCRETLGRVYDYVRRDDDENRFANGFSEICLDDVKFTVSNCNGKIKPCQKLPFSVQVGAHEKYAEDSYEYAISNAYNACLLGIVFCDETFAMETRDGRRISIRVCKTLPSTVDTDVLFVARTLDSEGFVSQYTTEEFSYIDGERQANRKYALKYSMRPYAGYHANRV